MKERRKIVNDPMYYMQKEPNFARLQMAVQRGAVIFGKDHVKLIKNFKQKEEQNGK